MAGFQIKLKGANNRIIAKILLIIVATLTWWAGYGFIGLAILAFSLVGLVRNKLKLRLGNRYNRIFSGGIVTDYTGGFNGYRSDLLKELLKSDVKSAGYGFMTEMKFKGVRAGDKIEEFPIEFLDRKQGKSKIPRFTALKSLILTPALRFSKNVR